MTATKNNDKKQHYLQRSNKNTKTFNLHFKRKVIKSFIFQSNNPELFYSSTSTVLKLLQN